MVLALRYGDLSGAIFETNKLANELGQYCDELSRKVQQKMYAAEGGMSSSLNSADYYVKAKINQLRAHENNTRSLSAKIQTLLDTAKRVDTDVEKTIQANQKSLFKKNPELKAPWYKQAFTSFMCDMKNVPVLGWLIKSREQVSSAWDTLMKDIRYWYKCEGGKELVGIVLSVAGVILAVVILVCTVIITGGIILAAIAGTAGISTLIGSVAGSIGALIGAVNAFINVYTSFKAYNDAVGGHPGSAKIYAGQDKLSDVLRQKNYHDREKNRSSNAWATGLDITEGVCAIVSFVCGAVDKIKNLKKFNISKTIKAICQPHNSLGQFAQGKPTLWIGIKSIALKFNIKDFVLGDLNVKNLSRLSKLEKIDILNVIGELAGAAKGIVDGLDKVNEAKQSITQFLASRAVTGLDTAFFNEQVLKTKIENGVKIRKFYDTNFTTIIKAVRLPIDGIGLGKILTVNIGSSSLSDVLNMKGGLIKDVTDIINSLHIWKVPQVIFDTNGVAVDVKHWDSALGYFNNINIPDIDAVCDIALPAFTMPTLIFSFRFECRTPYYNVRTAA